jgi:hypothetical protein
MRYQLAVRQTDRNATFDDKMTSERRVQPTIENVDNHQPSVAAAVAGHAAQLHCSLGYC